MMSWAVMPPPPRALIKMSGVAHSVDLSHRRVLRSTIICYKGAKELCAVGLFGVLNLGVLNRSWSRSPGK